MPVHPLVLLHSSLPLFTAQLVLEPAPGALPVGLPCGVGDMVGTVASPLAQRTHP